MNLTQLLIQYFLIYYCLVLLTKSSVVLKKYSDIKINIVKNTVHKYLIPIYHHNHSNTTRKQPRDYVE